MTIGLLVELLVALLLIATIYYCWRLNQRLALLRADHSELNTVIAELGAATARAERGLAELRQAAEAVGTRLNTQVVQARALADELTIITEAGHNLAERLSSRLTGTSRPVERPADRPGELRAEPRAEARAEPRAAEKARPAAEPEGDAERNPLLRVLREVR
ncbi:DUF6468 domain-containing protein [Zavarzinia sp. CC-PAN008]|uniref:DUF6468 domain-containing protein n=1 Tax=Zavarzinia sp. CC-PAN008 TaxID=3243332 RepID=UPI003F7463AA